MGTPPGTYLSLRDPASGRPGQTLFGLTDSGDESRTSLRSVQNDVHFENLEREKIMSTVPLTELRDKLSEVVDDIETTSAEYVITRHGRPVAVVLNYEEYESMVETLNILSDPETMAAIAEGDADLANEKP